MDISRHQTVILFTDIVGSVGLKNKFGTESYSRLLVRQRELFQDSLRVATGCSIMQHTGDGFLAEFQTSSQAVNAALAFQYLLSVEPWGAQPLRVRVGIHQGEVMSEESHDPGRPQLVGLAVDLAARVMGLALGGQILLTRSVFDDARQFVRRHPEAAAGASDRPIRWVAHGRYLFKGMAQDESVEVCEVGAEGIAPLVTPPDGEKAKRAVAADEEETLGWRPAVGLEVPGRAGWIVERKLGEGGFGEVWLASHNRLHERHVFKFCFDVQRLRSFKREVTLFRLLKQTLGTGKEFVPIFGVELETSPYYIESEFIESGNLSEWAGRQGGIETIPLETRLRLVAETARAVAAAHSVGIIHKDIKPTNILIGLGPDGQPMSRLCDFGIGVLADRTRLRQLDITEVGFTETLLAGNDSSRTGTRVYEAPEYMVGKPPTTQGDVFALGILLYQMVIGDLNRPLAPGWERDVADELLREDISQCVDTDPDKRFGNAGDLARSLEQLEPRRQERRQAEAARRRAIARQRAMRLAVAASAVLVLVAALCVVGFLRERELRNQAQVLRDQAQAARKTAQEQRDQTLATLNKLVFEVQDKLENRVGMLSLRESLLNVAIKGLQDLQAGSDITDAGASRSAAMALLRLSKGFEVTGRTGQALALLQSAKAKLEDLARSGQDDKSLYDLIVVQEELSGVYWSMGRAREALECANKELELAGRLPKGSGFSRHGLTLAYGDLAGLHLKMGKPKPALDYYLRLLAILEGPAESDPQDALSTRRNLSKCYCELGDVYFELGDLKKAREFYLKDLGNTQSLAKDPRDVLAQRGLAICYSRQSDLDWTLGQTQDSLANQLKSLAILEPIAKSQPDDTESQEDVAKALSSLGNLYWKLGQHTPALEAYQKSLAIRKELTAREPSNARALRSLSAALLDMGWFNSQIGRKDQVLPLCEQALTIRQSLAAADPESPQAQRDLSISLSDMGDANSVLGRDAEALDYFEKAQKIRQSLADGSPGSVTAQRDLSIGFTRLGEAYLKQGKIPAATEALGKAMKINEALVQSDPASAEARKDLALVYFRLGATYQGAGQLPKALEYYTKASALYDSLARDSDDADARHDQTVAYNRLGDLKMAMGQVQPAIEFYKKSLAASKVLAANRDNAEGRQDLSLVLDKLAQASVKAGSPQQAREYFLQKLAVDESAAKAAPDNPLWPHQMLGALSGLAACEADLDRHAESADHWRKALEIVERLQKAGDLMADNQKDLPTRIRAQIQEESAKAPQTKPATSRKSGD